MSHALFAFAALAGCSDPAPRAALPELPLPPPTAAPGAAAGEGSDAPADRAAAGEGERDGGPGPEDAAPIRLGRPVLLDFSRDHCLPCDLMRPWLDELRRRHAGKVEVLEVNIDRPENRALAGFFRARSVPLQVYLDADGREVARNPGMATLPQMQIEIDRLTRPGR